MKKLFWGIASGLMILLLVFVSLLLMDGGWKNTETLAVVFEIIILGISVMIAVYALVFSAYVNRLDTLIIILREQINAKRLVEYKQKYALETTLSHKKMLNKDDDVRMTVYDAFYDYYVENVKKSDLIELSEGQLVSIWECFLNSSSCKDSMNAIFKQMYYCIHTVTDAPIPNNIKKDHIATIQSSISSKILFCYLINQICFDQNLENNEHACNLRQFNFFKRLIISDEFKEVKSSILVEIINKFYAIS